MNGQEPIGYVQIQAWSMMMNRQVHPFEVEALVALDVATRFPGDWEDEDEEVVKVDPKW